MKSIDKNLIRSKSASPLLSQLAILGISWDRMLSKTSTKMLSNEILIARLKLDKGAFKDYSEMKMLFDIIKGAFDKSLYSSIKKRAIKYLQSK